MTRRKSDIAANQELEDLTADLTRAVPPPATRFARVLEEATSLGPGLVGQLDWIDRRYVMAGEHRLDQLWATHFANYFASGKLVDGILGGVRGGKTSSIIRALVTVALFPKHALGKGLGVVPIISARGELAKAAVDEVRAILRACGVRPEKGDEGPVLPGGFGGTYVAKMLPSGGGLVRVASAHGAMIEFRCTPAILRAVIGYTTPCAFVDEVDMLYVDGANPSSQIYDALLKRTTTTIATAKIFVASAYYPERAKYNGAKSFHQRLIEEGDTDLVYISRLGKFGAERDEAMRHEFAKRKGLTDPRLLARADEASPSIPAWCGSPLATIDTCYKLAKNDLDVMFAEYGASYGGGAGGVCPACGATPTCPMSIHRQMCGLDVLNRELNSPAKKVDLERPMLPNGWHYDRPGPEGKPVRDGITPTERIRWHRGYAAGF